MYFVSYIIQNNLTICHRGMLEWKNLYRRKMAKFNLDDYELVEDRIEKFWKDNPDGKVNLSNVGDKVLRDS